MTRKLNNNLHIVSHVKEKLVHVDMQTQTESQKLADVDEDIAKVSNVNQMAAYIPYDSVSTSSSSSSSSSASALPPPGDVAIGHVYCFVRVFVRS